PRGIISSYDARHHTYLPSFPTRRSSDLDFEHLAARIIRGVVNGRVGEVKTECSRDELPLDSTLAAALLEWRAIAPATTEEWVFRSEEHTSELQSRFDLVCRLLLEKKKTH